MCMCYVLFMCVLWIFLIHVNLIHVKSIHPTSIQNQIINTTQDSDLFVYDHQFHIKKAFSYHLLKTILSGVRSIKNEGSLNPPLFDTKKTPSHSQSHSSVLWNNLHPVYVILDVLTHSCTWMSLHLPAS